jgi:cytochrome c oxidase subunit IV
MTDDGGADSLAAPRPAGLALAAAFAALVALTAGELVVTGLAAGRAARITALAGLLMAKVGLVLAFFMHARASRRASALALGAIGFAAGSAVVLMLETVFRVGVR